MPDIGVVTALPGEAKTWGNPDRHPHVRVVAVGMGAKRASQAAEHLLAQGVVALVSWGVAGGLSADLQPGDLVLAERIDSESGMQNVSSTWNFALKQSFLERGVDVHSGRLWSNAQAVTGVEEKQRLAAQGHDVVDMEAAAVARVAHEAGVPFVALKCVCDPANRALPAFASRLLHADGRLRISVLISVLAQGPRTWRELRQMRSDFNAACAELQQATTAVAAVCPA